ncbi:IacB protein [Pokkaliibacter plantistimulans]|uniref:IacB protein n=2 Tax=Pseudomonadota TaxID=1224 RepID=A0ABX5LY37_9GAMM|nr:IacB protein [Pokkaliibacter plantistimulans]PPC76677.1 IacB protein [Pokkaliibacter plantistimulans]PXF31567.1 IacB protein [Pokkaliibacter plantistimulans]
MTDKKPLRVLFCMGINQNFFDAPRAEQLEVWAAFGEMWNGIHDMAGIGVLGNMDDDQSMVGPSDGWPWTTYLLADVADIDTVHAACNLFRTTAVGDGTYKLWRYAKVEARVGRELIVQRA